MPKSQLLTDLLTAVGIEARVRIVNIDSTVLRGLLPARPPEVTHAFTELRYSPSDKWLAIDSYVIDKALARGARMQLAKEAQGDGGEEGASSSGVGHGICASGTSVWDGQSDGFIQCNGRGGVRWTDVGAVRQEGGAWLPPGSGGSACARAAGGEYRNPPWFVLLPLRLLPQFAWEGLLNKNVKAIRELGEGQQEEEQQRATERRGG